VAADISTEEPIGSSEVATLRGRVRSETAAWHDRVDAVVAGPNAFESRDAYVDLLGRLYELHATFESRLVDSSLDETWGRLGIDVAAHRRAPLCATDLERLGAKPAAKSITSTKFATPGHALGCLYVLEGSSLGGRTVARLVRARIGDVPTSFFTGQGRAKPPPWTSVVKAMARFDSEGGDGDTVVAGACETFASFAAHLDRDVLIETATGAWA
jgi:heme oxygenase